MSRPLPPPPARRQPAAPAAQTKPPAPASTAPTPPAGATPPVRTKAPAAAAPRTGPAPHADNHPHTPKPVPPAAPTVPDAPDAPDNNLVEVSPANPPAADAASLPKRLSLQTSHLVVGIVLLLVLGFAAIVGPRWLRSGPPADAINAYLDTVIPAGKVRVKTVVPRVFTDQEGTMHIAFQARLETTEPLYAPVDAAAFVRDELHADAPLFTRAEALLASAVGPQLRERVGAPPANPATFPLLKVATPAGTEVPYAGVLKVRRGPDGWHFEAEGGRAAPVPLSGQPRPAAPARAYVIGDAADLAEMTALVRARDAYARRVIEAHDAHAAQQRELRQQALAGLQSGALFRGEATRGDLDARLWLEIASVNPTAHTLTAYLLNGGPSGRYFSGRFTDATPTDPPTVILTTRGYDANDEGGPFVGLPGDWQINLTLQENLLVGTMTGGWKYEGRLLSDQEAAAYRAEVAQRAASDAADRSLPGRSTRNGAGTARTAAPSAKSARTTSAPAIAPRPAQTPPTAPGDNANSGAPSADRGPTARAATAAAVDADNDTGEYPQADGAYARVGNEWRPLPRQTPMLPRSTSKVIKNVTSWIGAATGTRFDLPSDATFERLGEVSLGTGPVPVVPGTDVTIVHVGYLQPVPTSAARDGVVAELPLLAIGAVRADSSGARRAALYRLAPGLLTLHEGVLPGMFTRINSRVIRLTVSGTVAAGRYAITAGEHLYEIEVK